MSILPKLLIADAADITGVTVQAIHKKIKEKQLSVNKAQNKLYLTHSTSKEILGLKFIPKIYSFQLVKGGVGKTVTCFNFAIRCALLGAKVAIIELDQQANLTRTFNVNAKQLPVMIDILNQKLRVQDCLIPVVDGIDLLPSRVDNALLDNTLMLGKYPLDKVFSAQLNELKNDYDVIVIDCPPSISASVSAAALASDVIVMPVNPTDYAMAGLDLTYAEINDLFDQYERHAKIRILFNKYDGRTSLSFNTMENLIKHPVYGELLIGSYIRAAQSIENYIMQGKSVFDTIRNSNEKEDFSVVTNILLGLEHG